MAVAELLVAEFVVAMFGVVEAVCVGAGEQWLSWSLWLKIDALATSETKIAGIADDQTRAPIHTAPFHD